VDLPGIYAGALGLLLITLVIGTSRSAAGTKSWIEIGGVRIGQPAEFAKLATVLFLARYLPAARATRLTRALIPACMIAGVPMLLVLKQPDLGSAIVFAGILFAMLFWAGVRPGLLLLLASPAVSLLLAANTALWAAWMLLLFLLLVIWRVYVSEGVFIYLVNSAMGVVALVVWNKLKPYQQKRITAFINPSSTPAGRAIRRFSRRWRTAPAACSAPATRRAPRSGWASFRSSIPTSSSHRGGGAGLRRDLRGARTLPRVLSHPAAGSPAARRIPTVASWYSASWACC
jgi:hypothetical protein